MYTSCSLFALLSYKKESIYLPCLAFPLLFPAIYIYPRVPRCYTEIALFFLAAATLCGWTVVCSACPLCVNMGIQDTFVALTKLCQALEVKAQQSLALGDSARDLNNTEHFSSLKGCLDPLDTKGTCYREETSHTVQTQ